MKVKTTSKTSSKKLAKVDANKQNVHRANIAQHGTKPLFKGAKKKRVAGKEETLKLNKPKLTLSYMATELKNSYIFGMLHMYASKGFTRQNFYLFSRLILAGCVVYISWYLFALNVGYVYKYIKLVFEYLMKYKNKQSNGSLIRRFFLGTWIKSWTFTSKNILQSFSIWLNTTTKYFKFQYINLKFDMLKYFYKMRIAKSSGIVEAQSSLESVKSMLTLFLYGVKMILIYIFSFCQWLIIQFLF